MNDEYHVRKAGKALLPFLGKPLGAQRRLLSGFFLIDSENNILYICPIVRR